MNAAVIALALLGQCYHSHAPTRTYGRQYAVYSVAWLYVPNNTPWNQAVSELKSARASKQHSMSSETASQLQSMLDEKARLWIALIESPPSDKPYTREAYLKAKARLEIMQTYAARERR